MTIETLVGIIIGFGILYLMVFRTPEKKEPEVVNSNVIRSVHSSANSLEDSKLDEILVTSNETVPIGQVVKALGIARGSTVRAKHVGRDIGAAFKNIVGGELVGYTEMMAEAREEAMYRLKVDANRLGANAVTSFRFTSANVGDGAAEVTAYGSAVIVEELKIQ